MCQNNNNMGNSITISQPMVNCPMQCQPACTLQCVCNNCGNNCPQVCGGATLALQMPAVKTCVPA